jgi:pentatricopeptide repeat protein
MMRQHGVEPNLVTYNTLVSGYARAQRPTQTVSALTRLEEAGYQADDFTIRAFTHLGDRERALTMMEERIARNAEKATTQVEFVERVEERRRLLAAIEEAGGYGEVEEEGGDWEGGEGAREGGQRRQFAAAREFMQMREEMEEIGEGVSGG